MSKDDFILSMRFYISAFFFSQFVLRCCFGRWLNVLSFVFLGYADHPKAFPWLVWVQGFNIDPLAP